MDITKEEIKEKITTDPAWTYRAVVAIYEQQTEDEKWAHGTKETNGFGFSKFDADFLSSIATQIITGQILSNRQLEVTQKKIGKYAGQLLKLALRKEVEHVLE